MVREEGWVQRELEGMAGVRWGGWAEEAAQGAGPRGELQGRRERREQEKGGAAQEPYGMEEEEAAAPGERRASCWEPPWEE